MRTWRLAALAAALIVLSACAAPLTGKGKGGPSPVSEISPTSAPSPTPAEPLKATGPAFHGGEVGVAYAAVALSATGGVQPYKWSILSGALPPGMSIGNDGSVAGTPTGAGHFTFAVQVADAASSTAGFPADITIAPPLTLGLIGSCAQYCRVELGCTNACGNFGQLTGGAGPFTYSLAGGQLPSGTSLNGLSLNGTFKGQTGWLQFTVQVTDGFGGTASISPKFWMYDHVSLAGDAKTCLYIWTGCSLKLPIAGGVPGGNPTVALVAEAPQPGIGPNSQGCWNQQSAMPLPTYTLIVSGGFVQVDIPRPGNGYGGIWSLVVTDHTACGPSVQCSSNPATINIGINCT